MSERDMLILLNEMQRADKLIYESLHKPINYEASENRWF